MNYIIFISIVLTILTAYHYIKYKRSTYEKFDYYLGGQTHEIISFLITGWITLLFICFIIGSIYFGGELISLFMM